MSPRRQKRDAAMKHGYSGIGPGMAHGICRDKRKPSPCPRQGSVFTLLGVPVGCSWKFPCHVHAPVFMFKLLVM